MNTLEQLNAGCEQALREGYSLFVSAYTVGKGEVTYHVTLNKYMTSGGSLKVEGSGKDVTSAFNACFANFPKNPLQTGVGWVNNQLSAPEEITEGRFTETQS